MARLAEEALKAGAVGFTTSRTDQHKTLAGDLVPGRYAEHEELLAIGRAMGGPAAARSACSPTSRTRPPSSAGCARWRRTAAGRCGSRWFYEVLQSVAVLQRLAHLHRGARGETAPRL